MTALRQDAMNLLEQIPEDKLYFIVQIMQGVNGLYSSNNQGTKEQAFKTLEGLRKKMPQINYDKELEQYKEEKYGYVNID